MRNRRKFTLSSKDTLKLLHSVREYNRHEFRYSGTQSIKKDFPKRDMTSHIIIELTEIIINQMKRQV